MREDLRQSFERVAMLAMDVDGVLASPHIIYGGQGEDEAVLEIKQFCVHDGAATWAGRAAGLIQVVLSGRDSVALRKRLERMRVDSVFLGDVNKLRAMDELERRYGIPDDRIAYIGDDFLDLPIMRRVGLPIAVADATPEMKEAARYVTEKKGGDGAVGEVVRLILQAQGKWDLAVETVVAEAYAVTDKRSGVVNLSPRPRSAEGL